jgi:hypothetical protein
VTAAWKALSCANAKGEQAPLPMDGLIRSLYYLKKKRSEISGRDLQKPFGEFKNRNSLQDGKY